MNRLPLILLFGLGSIVMIVVFFTLYQKSHPGQTNAVQGSGARERASAAALPNTFDKSPTSGEITRDSPTDPAMPINGTASAHPAPTFSDRLQQALPGRSHPAGDPAWREYEKAKAQTLLRAQAREEKALEAPTAIVGVPIHDGSESGPGSLHARASGRSNPDPTVAQGPRASAAASVDARPTDGNAEGSASRGHVPDPNMQSEKRDFLNAAYETDNELSHQRQSPRSAYEVVAGTVIPAVMISGLNSDLPGQIVAEVRENVYDTATGGYLIIPQGAKLVGNYDSKVSYGQSRVLTTWHRIVYPDASSVDLGTMPGSDQSGYSGFKDRVDNHYLRIIGSAALLSLFSAGIQLSQPQPTTSSSGSTTAYSSQQVVAAALGQQLGELGEEVTRRNLEIQPTLEIRPGYLFNVMVTKDLNLTPWGFTR